jgi:uncharacterized phage protein (TIGR02220 family)
VLILDSHIEGAQLYSPRVRGDIYRAIIEYGYFGMEPDWLKGEALGFFIAIKPTLDKSKARANAGRKGGQASKQNASKTQANAKQTQSEEKEEEKVFVSSETNNPKAPSEVAEVIGYLNERAGRSYKATSEQTRKLIGARLAEGFTVDDCKRVIDNKVSAWLNDPKMDAYLRPSTLFSKSKFEGYLNERPIQRKGGGQFDEYAD